MEIVSIIMSTYNESREDLERAIQSILNQSYRNIEFIIICDNPKNMELQQFLFDIEMKNSNVHVYVNQKNIGLTASLNKALSYAQGQYIARMDADDYSYPTRIQRQLEYIKEKDLDLIGCYVECVDEAGKTIYYMNNMPTTPKEINKKIRYNNPIAHPTWFGKREVFIHNQGYREVPYAEDFDFLLRAIESGASTGNLNEILFKYTIRDNSISKSNGLKQFLISKALIRKYKQGILRNTSPNDIANCIQNISSKSELRYAASSNDLATALRKMNKKDYTFILHLIHACLRSRYFVSKMIGYGLAFL